MTAVLSMVKRVLASNKISFILTAIVVLCATSSGDAQSALSNGNYTWLLAITTPFFVVYYDYTKLMHLGTSKRNYFLGSLMSYGLLSLFISLINTVIHLAIDPLNKKQTVINLMELCGWMDNGVLIAFFQQAIFLLLAMIFLHVLLFIQPYWYGWLTDFVLAAVICVFLPIVPLHIILVDFFHIIMFNNNALLHIGICLLLSTGLSLIGLVVLKRKTL